MRVHILISHSRPQRPHRVESCDIIAIILCPAQSNVSPKYLVLIFTNLHSYYIDYAVHYVSTFLRSVVCLVTMAITQPVKIFNDVFYTVPYYYHIYYTLIGSMLWTQCSGDKQYRLTKNRSISHNRSTLLATSVSDFE